MSELVTLPQPVVAHMFEMRPELHAATAWARMWYAAAVRLEQAGDYATAERYWMHGDEIYATLGDDCSTWTDAPVFEVGA